MKRLSTGLILISPVLFGAGLYGLLASTDPASVGPGGVLAVYTLLYLVCLSTLFVILHTGRYVVRRVSGRHATAKFSEISAQRTKKAYYIASVLAFAPVTLLAMHAFSQLRWTDIALVTFLMVIATFYIVKRR